MENTTSEEKGVIKNHDKPHVQHAQSLIGHYLSLINKVLHIKKLLLKVETLHVTSII